MIIDVEKGNRIDERDSVVAVNLPVILRGEFPDLFAQEEQYGDHVDRFKERAERIEPILREKALLKSGARILPGVRELTVFQMLGVGLRDDDIASKLNISWHTLNCHRYNLFQKLQVHSIKEATILGWENGYLDPLLMPKKFDFYPFFSLSDRKREIAETAGRSTGGWKSVAGELGLRVKGLESSLTRIFKALDLQDSTELMVYMRSLDNNRERILGGRYLGEDTLSWSSVLSDSENERVDTDSFLPEGVIFSS